MAYKLNKRLLYDFFSDHIMHYKVLLSLVFICIWTTEVEAQKQIVNNNSIINWESCFEGKLSPFGDFGGYVTSVRGINKLTIKTINNSWRISFDGAENLHFSKNGNYAIFSKGKDSIYIFDLKKRIRVAGFNGTSLKKIGNKSNELFSWLITNNDCKNFIIWNPRNNKRTTIPDVDQMTFCKDGKRVVLVLKKTGLLVVSLLDLESGTTESLWQGAGKSFKTTINSSESKIAFVVVKNGEDYGDSIYTVGLSGNKKVEIYRSGEIGSYVPDFSNFQFSDRADVLFFGIHRNEKSSNPMLSNVASVNVWSYKDDKTQDLQRSEIENQRILLASLNLRTKKMMVMPLQEHEDYLFGLDGKGAGQYYLTRINLNTPLERQFSKDGNAGKATLILNGPDRSINLETAGYFINPLLSPNEKYVIWFDQLSNKEKCYDIINKKVVSIPLNLSSGYKFLDTAHIIKLYNPASSSIAGWETNDKSFFLYDQYDIWKIDPNGFTSPYCITKGYGRKNKIILRLAEINGHISSIIDEKSGIFIRGIDTKNYNEGFLKLSLKKSMSPIKLNLQPYTYWGLQQIGKYYLVNKSGSGSFPNWYYSKDLNMNTDSISDVQPQKRWRWCKKQLIEFPSRKKGIIEKGILYLPEDFDPDKKYPVIFQYYEVQSPSIFINNPPKLATGSINPEWMCSRGYIIFQPDITFNQGKVFEEAYDIIMGAADFMATKKWADTTHIGLSGSSFGASVTNYVVTRTNKFAAAAPAFGTTNLTSMYGALRMNGISQQFVLETSQLNLGVNLWENQNLYINYSPVFYANKVQTPLLIQHNKADPAVPWEQGLQWFMDLRRLDKPVWLLEYDGEGHGVHAEINRLDYTNRIEQFFNHYLKNEPMPKWMFQGIPAKMKQRDNGFELINH